MSPSHDSSPSDGPERPEDNNLLSRFSLPRRSHDHRELMIVMRCCSVGGITYAEFLRSIFRREDAVVGIGPDGRSLADPERVLGQIPSLRLLKGFPDWPSKPSLIVDPDGRERGFRPYSTRNPRLVQAERDVVTILRDLTVWGVTESCLSLPRLQSGVLGMRYTAGFRLTELGQAVREELLFGRR